MYAEGVLCRYSLLPCVYLTGYTDCMKIKKLGHCCLFIEIQGVKLLTDPGAWTEYPADLPIPDIILITHEHSDHLHVPSLVAFLAVAPHAKIITNASVGKLLDAENIAYETIRDQESRDVLGILIEGFGSHHAEIYGEIGQVENTGYMIGEKLFYPGDALTNPSKPVDILALPVAGPWMRIREAIAYAKEIHPHIAFPVHDAMLRDDRNGAFYYAPTEALKNTDIKFVVMKNGEEKEF